MSKTRFRLISHDLCPYVQRARIVLDEKSVTHELVFINLAAKPEWFLAISPLGKVPVLVVDETPLFESAPIVEYLDEVTPGSLHAADPLRRARHRGWIQFASDTLDAIASFYAARDWSGFDTACDTLEWRFERLERELDDGRYFDGDEFSLVDAAFAPVFRYFDVIERYADIVLFERTPRVRAWREALAERPSVQRAVVPDYAMRLQRFLVGRGSILSDLIRQRETA